MFGKEHIANAISRAKFYRDPGTNKTRRRDENDFEVRE
jgi:hypothetical protein